MAEKIFEDTNNNTITNKINTQINFTETYNLINYDNIDYDNKTGYLMDQYIDQLELAYQIERVEFMAEWTNSIETFEINSGEDLRTLSR